MEPLNSVTKYESLDFNSPMGETTAGVIVAEARSLSDRVQFRAAVTAVEPVDLVICVGAEHVFGTLDEALESRHQFVKPGGRLLLGSLCWERTPTADLSAAFDGVPALAELIEATADAGWRPLRLKLASLDDWDRFEFGFLGGWESVVMNSATQVESAAARRAADDYRESYLRRRGELGFAFVTLGRPMSSSQT